MEKLDSLFCELGKLLAEAEVLGTLTIPSLGKIGAVKKQLVEEINKKPPAPEPEKEK